MAKSRPDRGNILENRELLPGILAIASPKRSSGDLICLHSYYGLFCATFLLFIFVKAIEILHRFLKISRLK